MKLTDEQIAEFEARAEAGEKPTHPGWEWQHGSYQLDLCPASVAVYRSGGRWSISGLGRGCSLSSRTAAQLATEHLLREATRGLHREAYEEAELAWRERELRAEGDGHVLW